MAITNLRVVYKISTCVSAFTEMVILKFDILKAAADRDTLGCRLREGCHCEKHKIIWRDGPERDMIFHSCVTACREHARQPLS